MGEAVIEAEHERDEQRKQFESSVHKFEERIKKDLNWKQRIADDGARIVVVTVTSLSVLLALVAVKRMLRHSNASPEHEVSSLVADEPYALVALELNEIRNQLQKLSVKKQKGSIGRSIALRAATAGGTALGTVLAKQIMERMSEGTSSSSDE